MRGRPKQVGRLVGVRLTDVDPDVRRKAVAYLRKLADVDAAPEERLLARLFSRADDDELDAVRRAAEHPSSRIYWLPETAVRKVLG